MTLALDKRQGHFVVVDADNPEKVKSIKYKKELNALRWIKLATGFPRDVAFMNVRRLYEEREALPHEKTAHERIAELRSDHNLGFMQNPGGGVFTHPEWGDLQISMGNDEEDLAKLEAWLIEKTGAVDKQYTREEDVPETEWIALYFCTKCNRNHEKTSNIGREHLKYREVN